MACTSRIVRSLVILLLLGTQILYGDTARVPEVCGRTKCNTGSTGKFKYVVGIVYRYHHKVDVSLNLGNGSSTSDLHIESVVAIKFTSPCEADLRISKASIRHATRGKYDAEFPDRAEAEYKEHLERYSLRFAFEDGHVHELCPYPDDAIWAVNIKRGVLSMLQNTMKRFDVDHRSAELDVNGICDTHYRLHEARKTSLIIFKTKDLYSCTNRGKHLSIVQSNVYASPPTRSQATLLDSKMDCEIVIDHNVYQKVRCEETHRLQPLSNGDAAVRANTFSSLDLIEESSTDDYEYNEMDEDDTNDDDNENAEERSEKSLISDSIPTNLLYDHSAAAFYSRTVHGELRTSRDLLKSMCTLGTSGLLEQSFSEAFSKFVHSARLLNYPSLSQLLARANLICRGGRTYILDALPYIGTSAAIKVMRDSMLKRTVDRERSDSWMTAIALAPRPDSSTVATLLPLLESDREIHHRFTLVYSAVIRAFCLNAATRLAGQRTRSNFLYEDDCLAIKGTGIDRFLDHLELTIERGCESHPHDLEDIKKTLKALKAIGNMGLERTGLSEKLEKCINNAGGFLTMETRIAAIDAHRRLPSCQETRDRIFLPLYRNVTLESEIRIASYLQAMRCPDYNVIRTIKLALKEEPINQVGSFVWSHLTNLLASSSPTRIEIQSLLTDRDISGKFNSDARKYSRNFEKSFFSEEYNVGGTFQTNVIFSTKSYVPRTITFNVTLDLFGESVNFLEATMRIEGMEYYTEKFFGPDGPFANEKISQHIIKFLRSLRSVEETNNYWETLKTLPNVIDNNFDDPRISISYKIFGNELDFMMLRGPDEIAKSLVALDPWQKIKRILSGKEIHYERTGMFLDASYVVPSTTGLPIRLDLAGSAACNFKFSGLLNSDRLVSNTEMELVGNLAPSVSIAVTGKMTVDAFYKSAAIKLRSNVYSSSAARLRLDVKGMKLVRLNLELPNRKLEVFTVRSDIVLVNGNGAEASESPAIPAKMQLQKYNTIANSTCSWPVIERLIGLKLCFDYQFPNVTEIANASYFFLNGPTLFRTSVIKADPSAESYLFEYSWNATATDSILKLAFDTPGSQINRESSVTVMFDGRNRNVSVLLRSAGNSLVAKGTYKRTDDEAMINIGLDFNGTKHLDGYIGYARRQGAFGFTYTPKLELRVNNESVIELSGVIRDAHKNNVSQCDIDLNFRTKKITSRVIGYIIRRNISITGNVKVEYELQKSKKETLQIEISLVNRSSKTLTHREAILKLQSSVYPQLNAIIETWYQQALGHLELHMEINTKPHLKDGRHKLTAQLVLTYSKAYFQSQEAKMNAFIAVSKPIQNLDIKVGVQRFSMGPSSKTYFLIRYAPGKEISLAINLIIPRSSMLEIEGHANMTIPNFESMLIDVRVTERLRGEYDLDFAGTWFSGHNATIRGTYADRSSIIAERQIISHNLKLILRSPSLARDILLNCKLYRDHVNTKFDIDVEYLDTDRYALKYEQIIISLGQYITHAEARYKSNMYAITATVDAEREVRLELHLDKWRDIHLVATAINEDVTKELGIEIKWHANRDPALKFATLLQLNKFSEDQPVMSRNLSAAVTVTYPGRLFTGSCLVGVIDGHNYILDARIEWDPLKMIRFAIDADYDAINWKNYFKFDSQLLTPFEQWKKTSLNARYHWTGEELTAYCDADWHDSQKFLVQFLASMQETIESIEWRANCGLTSTAHSIGRINANLTHKVSRQLNDVTADSRLLVNYIPDKVIDLRSVWHLNGPSKSGDNISLAGNLRFISPLVNYRSGDIICQLRLMNNWKFDGMTNMEIDNRKYTGVLRGNLARIKESMVEFNVTTPLEKYSFLRGRFGLSERNKHVVAEIALPSGPIGIEALCQLFTTSTYDFDVMLRISTHIDALQKVLAVAKLANAEADFRIAYNNITAGLTAIWHYNNLTDLHYSYVLFTPIHGLHESGIVVKLIVSDDNNLGSSWNTGTIDTEFSIRIVETKFGIQAKAGPKFSPLHMLDETLMESTFEPESDDFNWQGNCELNLGILEAIIGSLDLDKRGPLYQLSGHLRIPQGIITIDDRFLFVDVFNMENILKIKTPFSSLTELNYNYIFKIDMVTSISLLEMKLNINKNNSIAWIENVLRINYTYSEGEADDSQTHTVQILIETPKEFLGNVITRGLLEFDETVYKTKIILRTNQAQADFSGSLEIEESFLDGSFIVFIDSPALTIPKMKIDFKKDFTELEKRIECGIHRMGTEEKKCRFRTGWNIESEDHAKFFVGVEMSWIKPLQSAELHIGYENNLSRNGSLTVQAGLTHFPEQKYTLSGAFRPNRTIDINSRGPAEVKVFDYRFDGLLDESNTLTGRLINLRTSTSYLINSAIKVSTRQRKLTKIDGALTVTRENTREYDKIQQHVVSFTLHREENELRLIIGNKAINGSVNFHYINVLNWNTNLDMEHLETGSGNESKKLEYRIEAQSSVQPNGKTSMHMKITSPWEEFENFGLDGNLLLSKNGGNVEMKKYFNDDAGHVSLTWKLMFLEDMLLKISGASSEKNVDLSFFFENLHRAFQHINCGFDINIDRGFWRSSTNFSMGYRNNENIDALFILHLPPPNNDDHRFLITYHANKGLRDAAFVIGYNAKKAKMNYASDGSIRMAERNMDAHLRFIYGTLKTQVINNIANVTFDSKKIGLKYHLYTPKSVNEETAALVFHYDGTSDERNILNADLYYPSKHQIGTAQISYASLTNVNGTVNATTFLQQLPHAACEFVVITTLKKNKRFIQVFWSNTSALLNSDYSYHSERLNSNLEGVVQVEIPLSTRHAAELNYGYEKRPQVTEGHADLVYNTEKILVAHYDSKGESRAGFDKDSIQITLENSFQPLGITYIDQYEYSAGNSGTNYPTVEWRRANIYRLDNKTAFSIAGESRVKTFHEGQEIELKAEHFNRTVRLRTDYRILPGEFDHNCWVALADDAWASYKLNIVNKTTDELENQFIVFNVAYPWRNFSLDGSYRVTKCELSSEAKLTWNKTHNTNDFDMMYENEAEMNQRERTIGAAFLWMNTSEVTEFADRQIAVLSLKHPSLSKDATMTGYFERKHEHVLVNASVIVDYSENPEKLLRLSTIIMNETMPNDLRYSYTISGKHPRTHLNLSIDGYFEKTSHFVRADHRAAYRRSYRPERTGQLFARLDSRNYQIEYHRQSDDLTKHLDVAYYPTSPDYVINGTIIDTSKDLNATGAFYFNFPKRLTWLMVNYTPDSIESLRMYGNIPDARNGAIDVWRTYERDLVVTDLSFYLRLNHSRLVTSTLKWRPNLKEDITDLIKTTISDAYNDFGKDVDYWKHYVRSETVEALTDIWDDARKELNELVDDWDNLKELDADLDRLKIYLNNSYNANDFYIKDVVAIGMYVIDELALRSHIESLPNILNEIWEIMGESGEAIRNSLLWIIEATKNAYQKLSEIVSAILKGESISQIASIVEKIVEQYDKFIKDLHVSFIKYVESLWAEFSFAVSHQWDRTLKMIEPIFIRVLHYLEAVLWKASREVVDFLYDRRNELIKSPYFDRFTHFSQDVDKLYRDIKGNDIITNIRKYSALLINFIRERYFTMVPFGSELKGLIDEILSELAELKKLPSVNYALQKINYVQERFNYFYEYFGVQAKIESAIKLIHTKLMDISQTALQAESRYREAKTKFIFDPNTGLMCLEQKLPMSWHAFNQTPEFQEIPEYRAIIDVRNYFRTSNATFWTLYYRYRSYTDPYNWLPPFKAQAMIVGSQHFVTFDGRHFDFAGTGTYLLARDFVLDQFAVLISYSDELTDKNSSKVINHKIIVSIGRQSLQVDIFNDRVQFAESEEILQLPVELENGVGFVHQEDTIVTIELQKNRFMLKCNLKYDVCVIELSGWFYGKTAGLLGTMNNERWDDILASDSIVKSDIATFAESWSLPQHRNIESSKLAAVNLAHIGNSTSDTREFCDNLFSNKSSEFGSCFMVIEPEFYAEACMNVRSMSEACSLAIAYVQICGFYETYLRIPDKCTACPMINGTLVPEGEFRTLEKSSVPNSTDVVFIVEAKECNVDIRQNRSIDLIVSQLNKELHDRGLKNNRWSLVIFGGDGVYDMPRSLILDSKIFTDDNIRFLNYFNSIHVGNGNQDIFAAIGFASELVFRAGVSKTFILMPCSHCEPQNQTLDYSVLHQVLLEHDITLHILMDGEFNFKKQRLNKIFFGLDATKSYTRKDSKTLTGDIDLRRQVKLPKSALGYCTPLSLETNGTIFSANKLTLDKGTSIKKFASVFAKRVASTADPSPCQHCECTADNDGVTHMECLPCIYPMPASVDYVSETFNEDDDVTMPLDDNTEIDMDDERILRK